MYASQKAAIRNSDDNEALWTLDWVLISAKYQN
jgi:hypothetical protein